MQRRALEARAAGQRIAFVPTMGYLHEGHLSLLREARRRGDVLVLSIFVNPTQFGPSEDLARYPRDLEGDLAKAASSGTDLVLLPEAAAMYPSGYQTFVDVREVSRGLCGDKRPGHFVGVATVVLKLFQIVLPHVALFGDKDYQQLQVLKRMVADLNVPVEVVGMPIVREADGLAMSSRNAYLSPDERKHALVLSRGIAAARERWAAGERGARALEDAVRAVVMTAPGARVDYIEARDAESLRTIERAEAPVRLALAVFIGKTRLIDGETLR